MLTNKIHPSEGPKYNLMLEALREVDPELAEELSIIPTLRFGPDEEVEDRIADDYGWLWNFQHNNEIISLREANLVLKILSNPSNRLNLERGWATPMVLAALREATKEARVRYEISTNKVIRELGNILDSNITDFIDVDPTGIQVKDFSLIPRQKLAAIKAIHEIRNAQGVQIKIELHDKMAALNTAAKLLEMNPADKVEVKVSGLADRLNAALERVGKDDETIIEGEWVRD